MVNAARDKKVVILPTLRQIVPRRRRSIIITGAILAALLVAGYGLWSMNTWSSYRTAYQNWQKELRTSVDAVIALPVKTSGERAKKMAAFKGVTDKIDSAQRSLCHTPGVITWQHVIGDLHQREEACGRIIDEAGVFGEKMQATTSYLKGEQALAAAIGTALAASEGKVTEETWGAQIATWQDAETTIAKTSSAEPLFTSVKTVAAQKVKSVGTAWQDLIAAHTAKDKTKYSEAQTRLVAAYADLSSVSTTSAQQLTKLTASLQSAYLQLFNAKV